MRELTNRLLVSAVRLLRTRLGVLVAVAALVLVGALAGARILLVNVLPNFLQAKLTEALGRDVAFTSVDTNLFTYFSIRNLVIAKGDSLKEGSAVSVKEAVIKYKLIRVLFAPKAWTKAIKRVEVIEPRLELAMEEIFAESTKRASPREPPEAAPAPRALPPLPKTFMRVKDGTILLTRRGEPVLDIREFGGNLDLRDLPRIEGGVRFGIAPGASLAANGSCHLGLRSFKGGLTIERLDLGLFSDLARAADPKLSVRVGGRLDADLEVQGGFMTIAELIGKTTGRGALRLNDGSLSVRGSGLVTGMVATGTLDGRRIVLEELAAGVFSGALDATGSLHNLGLGRLRLSGKLERVPVAALRVLSPGLPEDLTGALTFEFSASGTGRAPVFFGRLSAPELGVPAGLASDVLAEATYTIDAVRLTNLRANLWGGRFEGEGTLRGLDVGSPSLDFNLKGAGFDVARSPLGKRDRFAGRAAMAANLRGSQRRLTGDMHLSLTEVKAKGVPVGEMDASVRFEEGRVTVHAWTAERRVVADGVLALEGGVRCEACRIKVQERLPVIFALIGVKPPEGFEGRASGNIRVEGALARPEVHVEAVGSGVRIGSLVLGDQIRLPEFVYVGAELRVPEDNPGELYYGPERTRVSFHGAVPLSTFAARGSAPLSFHMSTEGGRLEVFRRLGWLKRAEGQLDLDLDVSGTASYPVFSFRVRGEGKKLALNKRLFSEAVDRWELSAEMEENEGYLKAAITVNKQIQTVEGPVSLDGWAIGEMNLETYTAARSGDPEDRKGLPLLLDRVAEIRASLDARLLKERGDGRVLITGRAPESPAALHLERGAILYAGGEEVAEEVREPTPIADWAWRSLDFQGLVTFGPHVDYRPPSLGDRGVQELVKAFKGEESGSSLLKRYLTLSGIKGIMRDLSVEFDVRLREGSSLLMEKRGSQLTAKGRIILQEGGRLTVLLPSLAPPFFQKHDFTVVSEPGRENVIVFEGEENLQADVSVVGERLMYDTTLLTPTGEQALVEEMAIRVILTPPSTLELVAKQEQPFLNFKIELRTDPELVTGEVEVAGADVGGTGTAMGRPVTFRPDESSLFSALMGMVGAGFAGETASMVATGFLDRAASPLRLLLDTIGLSSDVSVKKARIARRRKSGDQESELDTQSLAARALDNTEITMGRQFGKNFYFSYHFIFLDTMRMFKTSGSALGEASSKPYGQLTELAFRASPYKGTLRARWFGLPDDADPEEPREFFVGGEVTKSFRGVNQWEPFDW